MKIHTSTREVFALLTALIAGTLSFAPSSLGVHEVSKVPSHFKYFGPANPLQKFDFEIVLNSRDIPGLERVLYQVSDPSSPKYGRHLSKEEVDFFFQPTKDSQASVITWLQSHGIHTESAGIILRFSTTVALANNIFAADFAEYFSDDLGQRVIRTGSYSLPRHLKSMISHVHPATAFPLPRKRLRRHSRRDILKAQKTHQLESSCVFFTLSSVEELYGLPQDASMSSEGPHQLSVFGLGNALPSSEDIGDFIGLFRTDLLNSNISYTFQAMDSSASETGDNSHSHPKSSPEADLDLEYTMSLTGIPVIYAANSDATVNAFLITALALLNQSQTPSVLSISYGADEDSVGPKLATSICNAFMALGARGVSVIVASGDGGVSGIQYNHSCSYYQPTFPASCPFLTSVGGTAISDDNYEIGASLSSGGFSSIFPRPDYQNDVVNHFLNVIGNSSNSNMYNSTNRAFPDIAAIAENLVLVDDKGIGAGAGTSFAAPIVASIIAMVNSHRSHSNKSTLGFLNPALYANSSMFFDVKAGNNPGCGTNGFSAVEGWDPVTGLGSPNFENLMNALG